MTLMLAGVINAVLAVCLLVAIVGMHIWAIWTSNPRSGLAAGSRIRLDRSQALEVEAHPAVTS